MSQSSINTNIEFTLNGQSINAPVEWRDIEISASFDQDSVQPNISIDSFRFVNTDKQKASKILRDWITNDNPGIFHGVPFEIKGSNNQNILNVFEGYVNLANDVSLLEDGSTVANIVKKEGLDSLNDKLEALTWGYLELIGAVNSADYQTIDYVVEKKFNFFEILMSNIVLFLLIKELVESIKDLAKQINDAFGHAAGGISGPAASAAWVITAIIIQALYTALIAVAVINLGNQLIELLLPRVRQHKCIQLRRALEIISNHIGLNLVSPLTELDNVYYLPSNQRQDDVSFLSGLITQLKGTPSGIPNLVDYGYNCRDFFNLVQEMTFSKAQVDNGDLQLRTVSDPYWIKTATYVIPDVLVEEEKFNTDELKSRFALLFQIDQRDDWTIDNYLGTAYERVTDAVSTPIIDAKFINGLDEHNIFASLGNRKDQLNGLENILKNVAQFLDGVVNTLGASSNLTSKITNKIGVLKVSDNNHTKPKLLYLAGNKMPVNHRSLFSAKVLYDKYYVEKSFVANNYHGQKKVFKSVRIPFGLEAFLKLITNSYCYDSTNKLSKVTNIQWNLFGDFAVIDYWYREVYTTNLNESFIEQP
jgi:hypothetical protein